MERIIDTAATGLGNGVGWMAEHGVLFIVFAVAWVAVGVGLVVNQGGVHDAWVTIRSLPVILQALVWLLFLPVMIGLWIWETSWPLIVRLVLLVGVAGWNLLILLPRAAGVVRT
jgi:hypothetical protein